jgi:hypothetical protein
MSKVLYLDLIDIFENCDCILHHISDRINRIMDGSMKRSLTDWWLNEIESHVDHFLFSNGFVLDAVPEDYTNRPPQDMSLVLENLRIIQDILDPVNEEKFRIKEFVIALKDMIYVRIDAFTTEVESVLKEELPFLREGMSSKTIHKLLRDMDDSLDQFSSKELDNVVPNHSKFFIRGMLKDLSYLFEMKKMDEQFGAQKGI